MTMVWIERCQSSSRRYTRRAYFAEVIFGKICKVVRPRDATEAESINGFMLLLEAEQCLENLEEVEKTEVVDRLRCRL